MEYIKKSSVFLLISMLIFYIGYSALRGTYSVNDYSINTNLNIDKDNKWIKYLNKNDTVSSLLEKVEVVGADVRIYDSFNNEKTGDSRLATGDVLRISFDNQIKDEYILSVLGDANGDSFIDLIDLVQIRKHIVGWIDSNTGEIYRKNGIYYYALDMNKDGIIDLIDLVRIRKVIVGMDLDDEEDTMISYVATFNKNGATDIGDFSLICTSYDSLKCKITTPKISFGGIVLGWSTDPNAKVADVAVNTEIELTNDVTYYAITKKTYTASFYNENLDYLEFLSSSCDVYNKDKSCKIILPSYNKMGHFNSFWSTDKKASTDLSNTEWRWQYFNQVGHEYELTEDILLYPNFNHFYYHITSGSHPNVYEYRNINMVYYKKIGQTIFEFEDGIPQTVIDTFVNEMKKAYNIFPWLFTSGKVFIMLEDTYSQHSYAYGLTHQMYSSYGGDSHFIIDLKYDASGVVVKNAIDINAALHELAHAWDSYYYFKTETERISSLSEFDTFYNSINSKLYVNSEGKKISKVETFAGMFTNYYWHILKMDDSKGYYALKNGVSLDENEMNKLQVFMEKYINIAKNGY